MTNQTTRIHVPVLTGPTAAGKTGIALQIAQTARAEIISCDSRQVYRYMDIGTAKPLREERERVRHWLIDILDPAERYNAAAFVRDAGNAIRDCAARGVVPLLCGGTGLYLESLRKGIGPQIETDPELREALLLRAQTAGNEALHRELLAKDPEAAADIHANDVQRIVRALAVFQQTGRKISELQRLLVPPADFEFTVVALLPPRSILYANINQRVDEMVGRGLLNEFRSLRRDHGYDEQTPGLRCVGYQELFAVERGECSFGDAVEKIKRHSRQYAKRQITWIKIRNSGDTIIECSDGAVEKIAEALGLGKSLHN